MAPRPKRGAGVSAAAALVSAKLASSGLTDREGLALAIAPADPSELAAAGLPAKMAMELPYFDMEGRPTGFKRWRYLEDTREGFALLTDAKPLRYVQKPGSLSEVYLPPLADWTDVAGDTSQHLTVTEGELKAACATKHGYPCMGLGGVYSFRSTKKGLPLLPAFGKIKWSGRQVYVAYDSDAVTNHMVVAARNALCRELLSLGATPHVVEVPPAADGGKQGLDDFVLAEGPEALGSLYASAESFATSEALHDLNAEVAYVRDPGMIVVVESGLKMRPSDFTNHAYANWHYVEQVFDAKGVGRSVKKKAAPKWLEWECRAELERIVYSPGQPRVTEKREFNSWSGWGCEPKKGDVGPWKHLLDRLFEGKPAERQWFERWCAIPLQQPGAKMYSAAVIWGVNTGTGKSLVGTMLSKIYGRNATAIGDQELKDSRNAWAIEKQFVMGDDVTGQDKRDCADRLKAMITQLEMRIDQKFVPSYTVLDCIAYYFSSNHPDTFFIEDDDRRMFVHEVLGLPLPDEFYRTFVAWMKGDGPSHLFHHLLNLDVGEQRPESRAMDTDSKRTMIDDGLSDMGRWVRRLLSDPDITLKLGDARLPGDLWSAAELARLYDPEGKTRVTAGGLGKEMKRAGLKQAYGGMPVKTGGGQTRLFAVRNADKWLKAKLADLAAHYDSTRMGGAVRDAAAKSKKY